MPSILGGLFFYFLTEILFGQRLNAKLILVGYRHVQHFGNIHLPERLSQADAQPGAVAGGCALLWPQIELLD